MSKTPPQLGRPAGLPASPDEAQLDRVANPHRDTDYVARFTAPEFTCLCPITGQPDFAHLVIDYVPGRYLVESKSLKLYLASFRNHGAFHEDCTVAIGKRLVALLKPKYLRIGGYWYPRGGRPGACPKTSGCPTRVSRPIAGAARSYRGRRRPAQPLRAGEPGGEQHHGPEQQHRVQPDGGQARAIDDRPDRLPEEEEE